jgi:nucleotide-binding universal stress UspA family protein
MLPIKTILHPTDYSDASEHARQMAYELALDYKARLIIMHAVEPPVYYGELGVTLTGHSDDLDAEEERISSLVEEGTPVAVETLTVEGIATAEILRAAREQRCDLVVLGSHGRTGLDRVLMGSVAEEVARKSPCPVLIVRAPHHIPHEAPASAHHLSSP